MSKINLLFNDIHVLQIQIKRPNLQTPFWPNVKKNSDRSHLIVQRKIYEGWVCHFGDFGKKINIQYFVTKLQLKNWDDNYFNSLVTDSVVKNFEKEVHIDLENYDLRTFYISENAEIVRKKIFISDRFKDTANQIVCKQFFLGHSHEMVYDIQIQREKTENDQVILQNISDDISDAVTGLYFGS
jgi:hypothetical protein